MISVRSALVAPTSVLVVLNIKGGVDMSHYATDIKKATCYMHIDDMEEVLGEIWETVKTWNHYGWQSNVLEALTLPEALREFDIGIEHVYGNYYRPIFDETYCSAFFRELADIVAPYMTNGQIVVDNEYGIMTVGFEDGELVEWEFEEYEES